MKKKIDLLEIALVSFMGIMVVFTAMAASYDSRIFIIQLFITAAAVAFGIWRLFAARRDSRKFLEYIGGRLGAVKSDALVKFPLPIAVTDGEGTILWTNALFRENVVKDSECYRKNIKDLSPELDFAASLAAYGMILRDSPYKGDADLEMVSSLARTALEFDPFGYRADFLEIVQETVSLDM